MSEIVASQRSSRRARYARKLAIDLTVMTVVGIVLALIGPFGSFASPLPVRLVSWLAFSYIGYAIYNPMGFVVERLHRSLALPKAWLWVAACLVATVPMAILVWTANNIWSPGPLRWPGLDVALTHYAYVLVIGGGVTLLFNTLSFTRDAQRDVMEDAPEAPSASPPKSAFDESAAPQPEAAATPASLPPFFERLPPKLGTELIALEMEDHYVRAHTAQGSELILMRMRDAVTQLGDIDGEQVHRSWWVARGAVRDVRREGRNVRLVLDGDLEAPVSRSIAPQLKAGGWW